MAGLSVLSIDPSMVTINEQKTVNEIEKLDPAATYNLEELQISTATELKLNEFNWKPLKKLQELTVLNYKGDPQTVDLDIFEGLESIKTIILLRNGIGKVEKTTTYTLILPNLEELDLGHNKLTNFDLGVIKYSPKLRKFDLSNNEITTIMNSSPDGACMWPALEFLRLSSNKLAHFDTSFFSCSKQLSSVFININQLVAFGEKPSTCHWTNLQTLLIDSNKLTTLNEDFFTCSKKLKTLHLTDNKLETLRLNKETFAKLENLQIKQNSWKCSNLKNIVSGLNKMKVSFSKNEDCSGKSFGGICCY